MLCECIRHFSVQCGAEKPESLRGTKLRKHFATICIKYDLNEIEVTNVADFMGHHKDIHKRIYRQDDGFEQVRKLSQILEKAQGSLDSETASDCESENSPDEDNSEEENDYELGRLSY